MWLNNFSNLYFRFCFNAFKLLLYLTEWFVLEHDIISLLQTILEESHFNICLSFPPPSSRLENQEAMISSFSNHILNQWTAEKISFQYVLIFFVKQQTSKSLLD